MHQKVSVTAALCIVPARNRLHLYFRLHANANINAALVVAFLRQLRRQLDPHPIVLVWDRLQAHRAKTVHAFLGNARTLYPVLLPPYAPELNPSEYAWGYLKRNPLENYACFDTDQLADTARHHAHSLQRKPYLLRSSIRHSPLPLRLN